MTLQGERSSIFEDEYRRQRCAPRRSDHLYLHLSDLLQALKAFAARLDPSRVLDYGAGGSPYRELFPGSCYRRADLQESPGADYVFGADSRLEESDGVFDLILSTQVVEHVPDPQAYFREAYRLLASEGVFICTTHGSFNDHGCPHDYRRWTADGLRHDLRQSGFVVESVLKLTTGVRGVAFCVERNLRSNRPILKLPILGVRALLAVSRRPLHYVLDKGLPECRVADAAGLEHDWYVGLAALARKGT